MKKRYLFVALLLPFIFSGCDGNFGLQEIWGTYLVINNTGTCEVKLSCKSEKLRISALKECTDVTEEMIDWVNGYNLADSNEGYKVFRIPLGNSVIYDSKNVSVYFEANVNGETYTAELNIPALEANKSYLTKESVVLKNEKGDHLVSVFTYTLHRSI